MRPRVEVDVSLNGDGRTVTASIAGRWGLSHSVLLGRDVLAGYTVEVGRRVEELSVATGRGAIPRSSG